MTPKGAASQPLFVFATANLPPDAAACLRFAPRDLPPAVHQTLPHAPRGCALNRFRARPVRAGSGPQERSVKKLRLLNLYKSIAYWIYRPLLRFLQCLDSKLARALQCTRHYPVSGTLVQAGRGSLLYTETPGPVGRGISNPFRGPWYRQAGDSLLYSETLAQVARHLEPFWGPWYRQAGDSLLYTETPAQAAGALALLGDLGTGRPGIPSFIPPGG